MKRLNVFLITMLVTLVSGCSNSNTSSSVACLGEQCTSVECFDKQLVSSKDGMLDFCQSPAFGTFAIEKDGITWHFAESVSFGRYVTGDYWVLDKGDGVKLTKITPMPEDGHHGSMINPEVGVQAYDDRLYHYDASKGVEFPVVLSAGDSLVSTISVMPEHLNSKGVIYPSWYNYQGGLRNAKVKNASVLTVVSEVPKTGSFRPPYVGTDKKTYNISDIDNSLLPKFKAPASLPDVSYLERGVERPWLMHNRHWTASEMHPVENQHRYFREIGEYLSQVTLVLMTDAATPELLYGFLQTGIDHYHTITMGSADNATFEFHAILTGMLLGDEEIARVWVDGRSKTQGRATDKYYFVGDREPTTKSSIVPEGHSWTGWNVMFAKQDTIEHEHLHPSEWHKVGTGGGIKQENYRHCCDSIPHFGMLLVSRAVKADKYWPSNAVDKYMDRWIWESQHGYGLDVIQEHNPSFKSHLVGHGSGSHPYLLGSGFTDDMYFALGYDGNVPGPAFGKNPEPITSTVEEVVAEPVVEKVVAEPVEEVVLDEPVEEESVSIPSNIDDGNTGGSSEVTEKAPELSGIDTGVDEGSSVGSGEDASNEQTLVNTKSIEELTAAKALLKAEYRSEQNALNTQFKVENRSLKKERRARLDSIKSQHSAKIMGLRARLDSGAINLEQFRAKRDKLRKERDAIRDEVLEQFAARKATLVNNLNAAKSSNRSELESNQAALDEQFNSSVGSGVVE